MNIGVEVVDADADVGMGVVVVLVREGNLESISPLSSSSSSLMIEENVFERGERPEGAEGDARKRGACGDSPGEGEFGLGAKMLGEAWGGEAWYIPGDMRDGGGEKRES